MEFATLNNGVQMPMAGIGTFLLSPDEAEASVLSALQCGYRLIDTANAYVNEKAVGRAIKKSGVDRKDIFLETKLWPAFYEQADAVDKTLERLGTDSIDLLLIHQPAGNYVAGYKLMEKAYQEGKVRAIGLSNFNPDRLADLIAFNEMPPAVNQVECNVFFQQHKAQDYMQSKGVQMQSWAPFAEGHNDLFHNETLTAIGVKYGKSVAQVVLRWQLQRGIVCIPKSTKKERMAQNFDVFGFTLSQEDMDAIAALDTGVSSFFDHRDPAVVEMLAGLVRKV